MIRSDDIRKYAGELGFDFLGVAPARAAPHAEALERWLGAGFAADMSWMGRDAEKRADSSSVLAGARSVIAVGLSYFVQEPPPELWNDPLRGRIARYAWGPDYHEVMLPMLRELGNRLAAESDAPVAWRAYVDTGPVLERGVAEMAGLGFVGRNTMLINQEFGSLIFLGELITHIEFESDPVGARQPAIENSPCGRCRRCLDACPTGAFPREYVLDANRCISWLTIENRGAIPEALRPAMRNWVFGCDECQTVCPWVKQHSKPGRTRFLKFDATTCCPLLVELMRLDEAAFRERFAGTPVLRAKRRGLLRNAAVALGNAGDPAALPVLEEAMRDEEPLIREHAEWALKRLRGSAR